MKQNLFLMIKLKSEWKQFLYKIYHWNLKQSTEPLKCFISYKVIHLETNRVIIF